MASDAIEVQAGGRAVRVESDRVIYPATEKTPRSRRRWSPSTTRPSATASCARCTSGRRRSSGGPRACCPGIVLSQRGERGGDAFYQKRVPRRAPDFIESVRIAFPSGRHADEICPTEVVCAGVVRADGHDRLPSPGPCERGGRRPSGRAAHRPRPAAGHRLRRRGPHRRRSRASCSPTSSMTRLPEDQRRPGHPHLRADRAEVDLHRHAPRRHRVRPRARAPPARTR